MDSTSGVEDRGEDIEEGRGAVTATLEALRLHGAASTDPLEAATVPDVAVLPEAGRLTAAVGEAARGELRELLRERANSIRLFNY